MQVLINIDVPDLNQGIAFYSSALPLQVTRTMFDGSVAEMQGANVRIYLLEKSAGSPATATQATTRSYSRHWTPVHVDFVVGDIDAAVARALAAGAKCETPLQEFEWGRLATFSDPFGNGFCLLAFRGGEPYGSVAREAAAPPAI